MNQFVVGEFRRSMDERYRISIPNELYEDLKQDDDSSCILAKERSGALSLWRAEDWSQKLNDDVDLIKAKIKAGHLRDRITDVQLLGRLLSTRHREVQIAGRGRLNVPEGFRDFLGVEPGGDVFIVGAAVCIEIWKPEAWLTYLNEQIPEFGRLVGELAR